MKCYLFRRKHDPLHRHRFHRRRAFVLRNDCDQSDYGVGEYDDGDDDAHAHGPRRTQARLALQSRHSSLEASVDLLDGARRLLMGQDLGMHRLVASGCGKTRPTC